MFVPANAILKRHAGAVFIEWRYPAQADRHCLVCVEKNHVHQAAPALGKMALGRLKNGASQVDAKNRLHPICAIFNDAQTPFT
ncbi:hypothetical protein NDU88_002979 [Pleurodeles waltl]|uniref:Uncharacterized protein n=1 Tax=Pleurodeles waltl TaxID=8319 RepID=A0AAV7UX61_PLEWA|nr:hypothetical protein NDU88_002979 [Pleurodeles waltl]